MWDVKISPQLIFKDVLFVPQFRINLLSVSALTASTSLTVTFSPNNFVIQDSNLKKMIAKDNKRNGLYILVVDNLNHMDFTAQHWSFSALD